MGTVVDDMGADYASVEYLAALQPDFVKIDRDLVVRAELEKEARQKMDLIVSPAKSRGIVVIAEGIEAPEQHHLCQDAGTDFLQGYLFGLPANPPALSLDELGIFPGVSCG